MKQQIETFVKQNKSMTAIAGELDIPTHKISTVIKEYWPVTQGRFTDLRLLLGLTPYTSMPPEQMERVPGGVIVRGSGGQNPTFWRIPVSA